MCNNRIFTQNPTCKAFLDTLMHVYFTVTLVRAQTYALTVYLHHIQHQWALSATLALHSRLLCVLNCRVLFVEFSAHTEIVDLVTENRDFDIFIQPFLRIYQINVFLDYILLECVVFKADVWVPNLSFMKMDSVKFALGLG